MDSAEADGRPPPCIGICYYEKLKALEAREELTRHNEVLKEVNIYTAVNRKARKEYNNVIELIGKD